MKIKIRIYFMRQDAFVDRAQVARGLEAPLLQIPIVRNNLDDEIK